MSYNELLDRLVDLALERHREKAAATSIDTTALRAVEGYMSTRKTNETTPAEAAAYASGLFGFLDTSSGSEDAQDGRQRKRRNSPAT